MASLSRVIEPQAERRPAARRQVTQPPADQVTVAQAMTRQAVALRTAAPQQARPQPQPQPQPQAQPQPIASPQQQAPTQARTPSEQWYRREDPYITAETDAAFAAFMAGDNPHLRTDEVPVVDFTSMIEKVGPDGRPVSQSPQGGSRMKLALAALAVTAGLAAAVVFGYIDIPGVDGINPDDANAVVSETIDAEPSSSTGG